MFWEGVIELASGTHNGRRGRRVDTSLGVATVRFWNVQKHRCFKGICERAVEVERLNADKSDANA